MLTASERARGECVQPVRSEYRPRPQIEPTAYGDAYLHKGRLANYMHQALELHEAGARSVLEVGVGGGGMRRVAAALLRADWTTCDVDPRLAPDVVGSVTALPFAAGTFDAAVCCQVLEHVPFELLPAALAELARVAKHRIVLSLPDVSRYYSMDLRLPGRASLHLACRLSRRRGYRARMSSEHYWEIGQAGFPWRRIRRVFAGCNLRILRRYRLPMYLYHHFIVLQPPSS